MTIYPPGFAQLTARIKTGLKEKTKRRIPLIHKWRIKRGDKVMIISGKGKHGVGNVRRVLKHKNRLVVEGQALIKDTRKATENTKGSFILREQAVHYSNVKLIDPLKGVSTRFRYQHLEDGSKVRIARNSGAIIPDNPILKQMRARTFNPATDTAPEEVLRRTYIPAEWEAVSGRVRLRTPSLHNPNGPLAVQLPKDGSASAVSTSAASTTATNS